MMNFILLLRAKKMRSFWFSFSFHVAPSIKPFEWIKTQKGHHLNGILADEMGTGKTVSILRLVKVLMFKTRNSLVICPKTLRSTTGSPRQRSSSVFDPDRRLPRQQRGQKAIPFKQVNKIFVTSYALASKDVVLLKEQGFYYLILYESQNIKNPCSARAMVSKALSAEHNIAISGTPMENSLQGLWSIFRKVLEPVYLPNYRSLSKTVESNGKEKYLQKSISPFGT